VLLEHLLEETNNTPKLIFACLRVKHRSNSSPSLPPRFTRSEKTSQCLHICERKTCPPRAFGVLCVAKPDVKVGSYSSCSTRSSNDWKSGWHELLVLFMGLWRKATPRRGGPVHRHADAAAPVRRRADAASPVRRRSVAAAAHQRSDAVGPVRRQEYRPGLQAMSRRKNS
jgi:hypothetical protein